MAIRPLASDISEKNVVVYTCMYKCGQVTGITIYPPHTDRLSLDRQVARPSEKLLRLSCLTTLKAYTTSLYILKDPSVKT